MKARILLVEDERAQREPLSRYLKREGYHVDAASTGEEGKERLDEASYDLMITDLRLPGIDGLELISYARQLDEELGVLLTTAYASVESAVKALRLGAHDYMLKPLMLDDVGRKVARLLEHRTLIQENARLRQVLQTQHDSKEMVAESAAMKEALSWIERAAKSPQTNVLIVGETGTGKEVAASLVHRLGPDPEQPFLAINLAAIPATLIESELFGHEKGAFTGAERRRPGILRAAGRGTVFLDEIGELPVSVQSKLLRALETRHVQPLGSDRSAPYEARVISATNRDLEPMIEAGEFRDDLYYRLNVIRIAIPPLSERPDDIPALVHRLLADRAQTCQEAVPVIRADAMRALCKHRWRGNVRELRNVLERALILADDGVIGIEQLPVDVIDSAEGLALQDAMERFERSHIAMVLRLCGGNRDRAAAELGVSPATLYRRLDKLQLKGDADSSHK